MSIMGGQPIADPATVYARAQQFASQPNEVVPNQHVVSKALLKRFARRHKKSGLVVQSMDLWHPAAPLKDRSPRECGKVQHFVRFASKSTEDLWWEVENLLPQALDAVHRDTFFDNPEAVSTILDTIALHFVRSRQTRVAHERSWARAYRDARLGMVQYADAIATKYQEETGLYLVGAEGRRTLIDRMFADIVGKVDDGVLFRVRVEDLFRKVRGDLRSAGLEILRPERGEFLIGDTPALTLARDGRVGVLGGVPLGDAANVLLPLSPTCCAGLGPAHRTHMVSKDVVDRINAIQVQAAYRHVYFRPSSGLQTFVRSVPINHRGLL
jgi:hypothetical protein